MVRLLRGDTEFICLQGKSLCHVPLNRGIAVMPQKLAGQLLLWLIQSELASSEFKKKKEEKKNQTKIKTQALFSLK